MATNRPPSGRHSVPAVTATARRRPSSPEIAPAAPKNSGKCQPFLFLPAVLDRCSAPSSGRRSPPATTAITGRQPLPPPFTSGRHLHNSPPASAAFRRHQQLKRPKTCSPELFQLPAIASKRFSLQFRSGSSPVSSRRPATTAAFNASRPLPSEASLRFSFVPCQGERKPNVTAAAAA